MESLTQTLQAMHKAGCLSLSDVIEGEFNLLDSSNSNFLGLPLRQFIWHSYQYLFTFFFVVNLAGENEENISITIGCLNNESESYKGKCPWGFRSKLL